MASPIRFHALVAAAGLALAFAGQASATSVTDPDYPRSLADEGPVAVSWGDPAGFTELRYSRNRFEAVRGDWVRKLARHLAERAGAALPPGERLEVEITDIELAGEYEPSMRADYVRVVRDVYPPRIDLRYSRYDAAGQVVDSGEARLTDIGFLSHSMHGGRGNDALRHEKRLIDDWVRGTLQDQGRRSARGD